MKKIAVVFAFLFLVGTISAWAICGLDPWIEGKVKSDSYSEKLVGLFVDGVHRIVESPYEIVYHPYDEVKNQHKYVTGLFSGLGKGLWYFGQDIVVAVVNIVSAPVPGTHGYLPAHKHSLVSKSA